MPRRVTNYYIILGPRDKAANKSTNRSVHSEASEVLTLSSIFIYFFLIHRRAVFALSQSEAKFAKLGEYSRNMQSESFWAPNTALLQFVRYPILGL